jgi:hypothetical protein
VPRLVRSAAALLAGGLVLAAALPAAAAPSIRVQPANGLHNGQKVKVTGAGLPATTGGKANSFFITECNKAVKGALSLSDESHCAVAWAKAVKVSHGGTFSTTYVVRTGKVGDGTCAPGGATRQCVLGVGDIGGQGAATAITFGGK